MNGRKIAVKKGDFVAKPAGKGIAHQFINTGSMVLQILDCGLIEADDIISYQDENVALVKSLGCAFKKSSALEEWSSDPNDREGSVQ